MVKHVLAVVFAEFDTKEGPVISSQWPEGFVAKDVWTQLYEFVILLNTDTSTNNVKIQNKAMGNLNDYPTYSSIKITLCLTNNYQMKSGIIEADYLIDSFIGEMNCHQYLYKSITY